MRSAGKSFLTWLDSFLDDWLGTEIHRPKKAMDGFVPSDGCMWCGDTLLPFTPCACATRRLAWNRVHRLGLYEPPLSTCIVKGKYSAWHPFLHYLGAQLGKQVKGKVPPNTVIVPMPMPFARKRLRRIDHALEIAMYISKKSKVPIRKALWRTESPPQAGKTVSMRKRLPSKTIRLKPWARVKGKNVLLVDDVLTTGRTLEIASNTLRSAGVLSIQVAVLAVTEMPQKGKKK